MEGTNTKVETSNARKERCSMWNVIWKLPIKPKLKYFLWKCIHDWLPSNMTLRKKGVRLMRHAEDVEWQKKSENIFSSTVRFNADLEAYYSKI